MKNSLYHATGRPKRYVPVRYLLAMSITVAEVLLVIGIVALLCIFVPYFCVAAWLTQLGCVLRIISSDDNPDYKVPWLLVVLILPVAGFMLYLLFYSRKLKRRFVKRLEYLRARAYKRDDAPQQAALAAESEEAYRQARMLCRISGSCVFDDTPQRYFASGEAMCKALLEDLSRAKRFIFMEYFIIKEGVFWEAILAVLKKKAANGVEIKLIYDDVGCMCTLPGGYAARLRHYGINAVPFSRLRGQADSEFNNRNHRKITVIDGVIGYTGGVNLADEYINLHPRLGHWKDAALRLEGEAVWELTRLFLTDYGINVRHLPSEGREYYPTHPMGGKGGYLIPFGDGPRPLFDCRVGKCVIRSLLNAATRYVWLTTPYLIVDNDLCQCIEAAALRGVDVRIVLPHVPDKRWVHSLTRSFYGRLMRAGVRIYEYEPGFVHAKTYLADDVYGMIGTVNLDYRSLVHHFENGVWLYGCACLSDLRKDLERTLAQSVAVTEEMLRVGPVVRLVRAVGRIFAPLL